ncbi:carboxylating nicotinate-nucleotide diphosphorylase [Candidatus Peregrinibacteria bacterium]|nr:carboxylating nicotinate-nucleotide diphosphorylase [Candidatus Peregrinibacteria bacterium]
MQFLNASKELTMNNSAYKKAVLFYVWEIYKQDLNSGDVTTKYFLPNQSKEITAEIVSNEVGILAGIEEAEWFLNKLGIVIVKKLKDGSQLKLGSLILKIKGPASKILSSERTLLNLIQRMSGVATATKKMSLKLPKNIKLLATRKTFWGMLDKKAVVVGGGGTHRLDLSDAVLIKDNHISLSSDFEKSLENVFKKVQKIRFIEIELESLSQVESFLKIYKNLKSKFPINQNIVVMLDNFTPAILKKIIPQFKKLGVSIELSGGITENNVMRYNIKGISAISSGSITTKANSLDISLTI